MKTPISVRECARAIIDAVATAGQDTTWLSDTIKHPISELLKRDDLQLLGVPRQGNNVSRSFYLYFDGQLSVLLFDIPSGATIPAHDHGVWEVFCVYRGSVRHKVWRRTDDGLVPGRADLHTVADDILQAGDIALVAPPADIHGFESLEEGAVGLTIVNGSYKEERLYYDPIAGTCQIRKQSNRH